MCYVVIDLRCPGHHHHSSKALEEMESWGVLGLGSAGGWGLGVRFGVRHKRSKRVWIYFSSTADVEHLRTTLL